LPVEKFDEIHYSGMGRFKIGIFLLNLVPYLALCIGGIEEKNGRWGRCDVACTAIVCSSRARCEAILPR
jgi:hypothetical protein